MSNDSPHDAINDDHSAPDADRHRRRFLGQALAIGAAGTGAAWWPAFAVDAASALATCAAPPAFPAQIPLFQQAYRNWSGEIQIDALWTCSPRNPEEVVTVVNWARQHGYRVRPRGMGHNWSPLNLAPDQTCAERIVMIDTLTHLNRVEIDRGAQPARVTAQAGISMQDLLARLEEAGLGLAHMPAPGDLSLGGVLAVDAHGTAVPALGETRQSGHSYGSLSNLVLSLTAVVWDAARQAYMLRSFRRDEADCAAFLAHLGRALIVEATLQAGPNQRLRCQSNVGIAASELFAAPGSTGRTFASFLDKSGRVETIHFPFTRNPWLKVWTLTPDLPPMVREAATPFNYPFSDSIPPELTDLICDINLGDVSRTPALGALQYSLVSAGLMFTASFDLWGWSRNLMLYVKPSTLRVTANGYAVITSRANVQRVVHEFVSFYQARAEAYRAQGKFPVNGPVEIRVTGLDRADEVAVRGAVEPLLSAVRPVRDRPEWDCAVWLDLLTLPGTPQAEPFYREVEQWVFSQFSGEYALARVEWSKGWGYDAVHGAWSDAAVIGQSIPNSLRYGQAADSAWDAAVAILNRYDPARVFSSPLLDRLLP
ncbi:cholesterol oxidase substrate-binding domain-containing protein [Lysobacter gummosus]|uniref:FAD-binding protein n=1 Tax=Lysobacter gummosus TaxID=262324 RepID=A0ABY3XJ84_9GAMM|nr:cholesterol oxidase substrate-binding domain-containing protein [Lysobacter gummosus]ALN91294.1 cholesterol oxidase [Lysobacter gummosus]UNP31690.1 FAD-binding protein [Lysobacter gummosus]